MNPEDRGTLETATPSLRRLPAVREESPAASHAQTPTPPWAGAVAAVGGAAGIAALIFGVGGAVMWSRLHGAGVAADEAMGAIPQGTIIAVGARELLMPAGIATAMFALTLWLERREAHKVAEPTPAPALSSSERGRLRRTWRNLKAAVRVGAGQAPIRSALAAARYLHRPLRFALRPVLAPVRWYFAHVPSWLWLWLPIILFLPDPVGSVINAFNFTAASAVGEWASERVQSRQPRAFGVRIALGLAVVTAASGLLQAWHDPSPLPVAQISDSSSQRTAGFVAMSGGAAYVVERHELVILPSGSFKKLAVRKAARHRAKVKPSLVHLIFG